MIALQGIVLVVGLLASSLSMAAGQYTAEQYIEEARSHRSKGDLATAAVTYQKALKLDQLNVIARRELRDLLIESKRQDPEGEYSEAEWALLEEQRMMRQQEIANISEE